MPAASPRRFDVFLSYAHSTNRGSATEICERLLSSDIETFFDDTTIEPGATIPAQISDAILGAKVVVLVVDGTYFHRWYCVQELRLALRRFEAALRDPEDPEKREGAKQLALSHLVVVEPEGGLTVSDRLRLPPRLASVRWPTTGEIETVVEMVRAKLSGASHVGGGLSYGTQSQQPADTDLVESAALPPAAGLAGRRVVLPPARPSLGDRFVNRADDLWWIDFMLRTVAEARESRGAVTVAIEAGAGFGKTQLAVEYAHRFGIKGFPGGVFWVDADEGDMQLEERFHAILQTLHPEVPDLARARKEGIDIREALARALRRIPAATPCLFIIDDFPEGGDSSIRDALSRWCPGVGFVSLLVTSRRLISVSDPSLAAFALPPLADRHSVRLLAIDLQVDRSGGPWADIARWAGGHPYTLALLNRQFVKRALTREQVLQTMQNAAGDTGHGVDATEGPTLPEGVLQALHKVHALSYNRLDAAQQRAARLLSYLAPAPIPHSLLAHFPDNFFPSDVKSELIERSFVIRARDSDLALYGSMHRILAVYLRSRSDGSAQDLRTVAEAVLDRRKNPGLAKDVGDLYQELSTWVPHAEHVFDQLIRRRDPVREDYVLVIGLGLALADAAEVLGFPDRSREVLDRCAGAAAPSGAAPITGEMEVRRAKVLAEDGKVNEARRLLEQFLSRPGGDRDSVLSAEAMLSLADQLEELGHFGEALGWVERAEDFVRQKEMDPQVTQFSELGYVRIVAMDARLRLLALLGHGALAEALVAGWLRPITSDLLGSVPGRMLNSTRVAALVVQERWDDAADVVEALVQSLAAAAGPEHYDVQRIEALLASIRTSQGRPGEARPIQRRWWKTTRQLLGDNHRQTALALSALGNTLGAQGKHRSAAVCLERALRLLREALPREHSEVLSAATNLAEEFVAIGERERAQHLLEEASATFSEEKAPGRRELWQAWDAHARLSGAPVLPSARRAAQLLRVLPERPVPLDLLLAVDSNLFTRATRDQLRELGVLTPTAGDGSRTFAIDFDRCGRVAGEEARSEGDLLLFADIVRQFIEALAVAGEIDRAVELRPYAEAINRYLIDQPSREATEQAIELCIALYTIAGIEDSTDRAVPFRAILKLLDGSVAEAGWVGARIGSAVERLVDIGRPEAALPLAVLSRDLQAHFHGEGHPRTAAATLTVARVLGLQGRYAEAEQLFGAVLGLTVEKLAYPRGVVRRVLCWLRMAPASDEHGRTEWMTLGLFAALGGGEIAQQGSDEAAELNWTEWAWSLVEVADAAIPSATFLPFLRRAPDVFVKHRMCEKAIRAQTMLVMILKRQHGPDDEEVAMQRNKLQQFEAMC